MKKIIIYFLLLQLSLEAASTKVTVEPVSNKIVDAITTDGFFSFTVTADGDDNALDGLLGTDIDGKLKLGEATLASCAEEGEDWKCKPSVALSYGTHTLAGVSSDSQIKSLSIEITDSKKVVEIVHAISATPKNAQVTGAIAANSEIEITLTANGATTAAVAGSALTNYFQLGDISLGTCTGDGLAINAAAGTKADIKCANSQQIGVSATPYDLKLQSGKTAVSEMSIGVSGSVTVSASGITGGNTDSGNTGGNTGGNTDSGNTGGNTDSGNTGGDNKTNEDDDSSFYLKNCLLVLLAILF